MSEISFKTKLFKIKDWTILHLPEEVSAKLPSRGMIMISGTLNGIVFKTLLEPDGKYGPGLKPSHWFSPDKKLIDEARARAGDFVQVSIEPTKDWINPEVPPEPIPRAISSPQHRHCQHQRCRATFLSARAETMPSSRPP